MDPLKDSREFGRRVSAARGYAQLKKTEFARLMGSSVPTITRWEAGERGSIGATQGEREQLAERIRRETGCPPSLFSEPAEADPIVRLEARVDQLAEMVSRLAEVGLEEDEAVQPPQSRASAGHSAGQAPGGANE
jgi:transcriptional regulator with XRE-family HTH domain